MSTTPTKIRCDHAGCKQRTGIDNTAGWTHLTAQRQRADLVVETAAADFCPDHGDASLSELAWARI